MEEGEWGELRVVGGARVFYSACAFRGSLRKGNAGTVRVFAIRTLLIIHRLYESTSIYE